jgi:2-hydroxy-3-oxopropionate reductase
MEAGYLGVGAMGQPTAQKLLDAGHTLTIYDINEAAMRPLLERQARRAASPRDIADRCEIVFVSLPTLAAFRKVAFGAESLACGKAMKLLVNTCTVGVPFVKEIERAMAAQGASRSSIVRSRAGRRARAPARFRSWFRATRLRSSGSGR